MSANTSFFDVSILKGKQIIWTINLSKKENQVQHSIQEIEPDPQNLLDLAKNYINSLSANIDGHMDSINARYPGKAIRKLAKKIIKYKRIRLSELASQLKTTKSNLKVWLKKGENAKGDSLDYEEIFKDWIQDYTRFLSQDEMNDVIIGFNKSISKNLINIGGEIPSKAAPHLIESILIDNRFPLQNIPPKKMSHSEPNSLHRIQIDVSSENISINDTLFWDEQDLNPERLKLFASSFVLDTLEEQKLNPSQETTQMLIEDVERQIKEQVEVASQLKSQIETLVEFNANSSSFKQKEEIIQISLNIHEDGYQVFDAFDWEIDPRFNQPEIFAEKYTQENNLPLTFVPIISTQIRQQIDDYLQKRLNNLCQLYEPKVNEPQNNENTDEKKKINNKVKSKILFSINENLPNLPITPPLVNKSFLKNTELFTLVSKYSDLLSPIHKSIFDQQKALIAPAKTSTDPRTTISHSHPSNKNNLTKKIPPVLPSKIGVPHLPLQNPKLLQAFQGYPQLASISPKTTFIASPNLKTFGNNTEGTHIAEAPIIPDGNSEIIPFVSQQKENIESAMEESPRENSYSNGFLKE